MSKPKPDENKGQVTVGQVVSPTPSLHSQHAKPSFEVTKSYGEAYEQNFRRTVAMLRKRSANQDVAEETAQAAWARGWERLPQLEDARLVVEWVNSIAANLLRDSIHRSRRFTELSPAVADVSIPPAANLASLELHKALQRCPTPQREALELFLQNDGRSTAAIANDLKTTIGALHHRLSRGRRSLRKAMNTA